MKTYIAILIMIAALAVVGIPMWLMSRSGATSPLPPIDTNALPASNQRAIRLDITPERNPIEQMRRYKVLGAYLTARLGRRVEISVVNTYEAVLADMREQEVEGAFLGSLVAVLAIDRLGAQVTVKQQMPEGTAMYRGVVIVPEGSPIKTIADLSGHSLGMIRATTAGELYPLCLLKHAGLLALATPGSPGNGPRIVWAGTHDEAIQSVGEGRLEAAAVKDERLTALLGANPHWKLRQIVQPSGAVPNNALVLRREVAAELGPRLSGVLLAMDNDTEGRLALAQMGVVRFVACEASEFAPIYDMAQQLGADWKRMSVGGDPPRRPTATEPSAGTMDKGQAASDTPLR
jgi:phosphate/phosphite/phosphonate ABC transporter binding protein